MKMNDAMRNLDSSSREIAEFAIEQSRGERTETWEAISDRYNKKSEQETT